MSHDGTYPLKIIINDNSARHPGPMTAEYAFTVVITENNIPPVWTLTATTFSKEADGIAMPIGFFATTDANGDVMTRTVEMMDSSPLPGFITQDATNWILTATNTDVGSYSLKFVVTDDNSCGGTNGVLTAEYILFLTVTSYNVAPFLPGGVQDDIHVPFNTLTTVKLDPFDDDNTGDAFTVVC